MSTNATDNTDSIAHTRWNCKYHVVFGVKYKRKEIYNEKKREIGAILRRLCEWKGVQILEAEVCPDHVHMMVKIPPKYSVSSFMGYLKGKSSIMIHERWRQDCRDFRKKEFWCRGYYVDTVGKDTKKIGEYIRQQLADDSYRDNMLFEQDDWTMLKNNPTKQ